MVRVVGSVDLGGRRVRKRRKCWVGVTLNGRTAVQLHTYNADEMRVGGYKNYKFILETKRNTCLYTYILVYIYKYTYLYLYIVVCMFVSILAAPQSISQQLVQKFTKRSNVCSLNRQSDR